MKWTVQTIRTKFLRDFVSVMLFVVFVLIFPIASLLDLFIFKFPGAIRDQYDESIEEFHDVRRAFINVVSKD